MSMENSSFNENVATMSNQCLPEQVLLQTLLVGIEASGKRRIVRAIVDTGSQRSYILKSTTIQMRLPPQHCETLRHVVFGGISSRKEHKCYEVLVKNLHTNYFFKMKVLDQETICGYIPSINESCLLAKLQEKGVHFTDVGRSPTQIELLIGADYAGNLYTGKVFQLESGLTAMETCLGWVLMGKSRVNNINKDHFTSLLVQNGNIADLWKLETIGIKDPCEAENSEEWNKTALEFFSKTVTRHEDGRYEIRLPWMRNKDELPSNRDIAGKRLISTTLKLKKENRFQKYSSVFEEWAEHGFIEESSEGAGHYLPHRGVFKSHSTTNVRPVFDASCKSRGNLSLNDCLMKGPNLLEIIPSVLMKFREKEIGVISDITKAFLQISVCEEDRKYLKFLWWENHDKKILKILQHSRVVFGLTCSPFLLGAVIQHHLDKFLSSPVRDTALKLKNSFYVDNCVTSVNSEEELDRFIKNSTEMMADAKFKLRGWEFTERGESVEGSRPSQVLGLLWDRYRDVLFCDYQTIEPPQGTVTRRVILSIAQRLFDPIGFTCPVTLCPKLLLQESWVSKLSWDSEVQEEIKRKFLKWIEDVKTLHLVKIPRKTFISIDCATSLHIFCDASGLSYAAVVFLRCQTDSETTVQLLMAKSRVAPLKRISIPRLELLSCCIGARLCDFVKNTLNFNNIRTYFWTDSSTALHWIKNDESWAVFVRNRVKEIRRLSTIEDWRHIPGEFNPSDLPSRGCTVQKLVSSRWWEGPHWLKLNEDSWPKSNFSVNEGVVFQEKLTQTTSLITNSFSENYFRSHFSSYAKTVRMLGWIFRFIYNSKQYRDNRKQGELSLTEISEAEKVIIKMIQRETLSTERIKDLKSLNVFKDEEGIFRIKTKLIKSDDSNDFKFPVIIPGKHYLVELLVRETHVKKMHAGVQVLLAHLREKYWIINGRRTVRSIINKCLRCKRYAVRSVETAPSGLPHDRIKEASVFEVVGVDLAGPLHLKEGAKGWIVLFTCAVYRAIHLELVLSLSTKAFLLSLRRFIARRGRPKVIYSDNGKNFVGAENLFQSLDWNIIEQEASNIYRIEWKFIPPSAPWFGGFWERMVQMVKKLLRRVLGKASLYYEEMNSILCDCESVINSRPLTYLSEESDDLIPLTPAMFLQDIPTVGVPDLDNLDKTDIKRRWKYQQTLREHLRKRFRLEYLGTLVQQRKGNRYCEIKVGDIVLIENDSKGKILWPMAKVIEVFPGKDGIIRVARLKTQKGEIVRPVRKMYPLEISSSFTESGKDKVTNATVKQEDCCHDLRQQVKRPKSGRIVKMPARFRDT